jgi:FtsH-binding integral membrane protein
MQTLRNVAIIALLALGVAALPGGGTAADTALAALSMAFLAAMGFFAYRLYMQNQLTLATLTDARRAILFGAFGVIALMIVGADELLDTGTGAVVWIGLIAVSALAIFRVWSDATTYS